jgi:O-antigen/teichoic acid export membrane protein
VNKVGKLGSSKTFYWVRLVSITGGVQAAIQGLGLLTGLFIIRTLSLKEYAYYTIANTMLGAMSVLADSGISTGIMAESAKVWNDNKSLGEILVTALSIQKVFAILSLGVSIPVLVYLLLRQNATWITIIFITIALIPAFLAFLTDCVFEIFPRIKGDFVPLQKNQILVAIFRMVLIVISLLFLPFTAIALLANGIPRIYGNLKLKKIVYKYVNKHEHKNEIIKKSIFSFIKKMSPGAIYFCLSGQITPWLISFFGNTQSIAEVGALSRLSMVLGLVTTVFAILVVPKFAITPNNKWVILKRFCVIFLTLFLLGIFVTAVTFFFPNAFLFLLGNKFSHLQIELVYSILAACIMLISNAAFSLYTSKGWLMNPWLAICINVVFIVVGALLFNVSTLRGILKFNVFLAITEMLLHGGFLLLKILKIQSPHKVIELSRINIR